MNEVETFVMQYMVSPPLLGTQSQAWWGAGVTFLGRLYSLDTFISEGPTSLWAVNCCLPSWPVEEVSRGLTLAKFTGSHT